MHNRVLLSALVAAAGTAARDIPSNVQTFVDAVKAQGTCSNKLATGFYAKDDGPNSKSSPHVELVKPFAARSRGAEKTSQPFRTAVTTSRTTM
jgi:hypothetical protein